MDVVEWLHQGDPAIRWQVLRDLKGATVHQITAERARIATEGWGADLLARQGARGRWAGNGPGATYGLYSPKWTSTTYTLLLLRRLGLPARNALALRGCEALVTGATWLDDGSVAPWASPRSDMCVNAMVLGVLEWFEHDAASRCDGLLEHLLAHQKADGGWNCRSSSSVSSVHTTISTLEALQIRRARTPDPRVDEAMDRAHEYLLVRGLIYRRQTGALMSKSSLMLSFPPRWKYDVLRALDHLQHAGVPPDARASDAVDRVLGKRRKDGTWPVQARHAGLEHFRMERTGGPSRWNTLRALRVLRWWAARG